MSDVEDGATVPDGGGASGGARSDAGPGGPATPGRGRELWWVLAGIGAVALVIGGLLLALGGGDGGSGPSTTRGPSTSSTSTTTSTTGTTSTGSTGPSTTTTTTATTVPLPGASTSPVVTPRPDIETAALTDVRVARQAGYDRVVFEFSGSELPGYEVRYVPGPVVEDPSGLPLAVAGAHLLSVRTEPASRFRQTPDEVVQTYSGPTRITGPGEVVEVVLAGDFEAVMNWVIGTRDEAPFRVLTLSSPTRLVVDVQHR